MTHILLHRSTLYWSWLCLVILQIHCVFLWLRSVQVIGVQIHIVFVVAIPFCQYNYGSAVYFMVAISKKYLLLKHRYACLGFETCHNICLMLVCIVFGFSTSIPFLKKVYKLLQSSSSSNFILWGEIYYNSKLLTSTVSQVSSLQVL